MSDSTSIPEGYKRCTKCGKVIEATTLHFNRRKGGKYGLSAECKGCLSLRAKNPPAGTTTRGLSPEQKRLIYEMRFWSRVGNPNERGCRLWTAKLYANGYGQFSAYGKQVYSHRFAWELTHGTIPDGLYVCHICDTPACCNPEHLFLGTNLDNITDMIEKGRNSKGEQRYNAKLTDDKVRNIRALYASGNYTYEQLAVSHDVTISCIEGIIQRRTWKRVD
jgi:hypothetical protein